MKRLCKFMLMTSKNSSWEIIFYFKYVTVSCINLTHLLVCYIKETFFFLSHFNFWTHFWVIPNMDVISYFYKTFLVTLHLMVYSYLFTLFISFEKCSLYRQFNEHYQSHHHNHQAPKDQFVMNQPNVALSPVILIIDDL